MTFDRLPFSTEKAAIFPGMAVFLYWDSDPAPCVLMPGAREEGPWR